ncbi:MAG: hypothetical protein ACP5K1_00185 [Candidatus Bathyarchaeia archaeon]
MPGRSALEGSRMTGDELYNLVQTIIIALGFVSIVAILIYMGGERSGD